MSRLTKAFLISGLIVITMPGLISAIDLSRGILLDIPDEKAEAQFGTLPPSQLTAQDLADMASYRFTGDTLKVLAILVEWENRPGTYPKETFDSLLFSRNFLPGGSLADYFYEVSYGQLHVTGQVLDWYNAGWYTGDYWFEELFWVLDPVIDYSQFDGDNNGDVDAAVFIRSGNGEEDSGDPWDIWSYAYVYPPGEGPGPFDGGMHIPRWNTSPEMRPLRNPDNPTEFSGVDTLNRIRVFAHEMSHCIGLPDLYDYDDKLVVSTFDTPGDYNDHPVYDWCLMAYYGYGLISIGTDIPTHLCGWSKKEIGWIDPVVITRSINEDVVIPNIETTKDSSLYLVPIIPSEGEYFLVEYRNPQSSSQFDKVDSDFSVYFWPYLTYGCDPLDRGLLITHVHDSLGASYWRINNGTPDYPHYTVAVEDAGYNPAHDAWSNPEGFVTDSAQWWYPYESRKGALFSNDVSYQEIFTPSTYPSSHGYFGPSGVIVTVDSIVGENLYAYIYVPAPDILSTLPTQNELNVPAGTDIAITFDRHMDETTIDQSSFRVNAISTGPHDGVLSYDSSSSTVTFDSYDDFSAGEAVTVVLTGDIKSSQGIFAESSFVWSFTVEVSDESPGTFVPDSVYSVGESPWSVFAADLDGDGDPDIATANAASDNISVLLNQGDGSFAPHSVYPVGGDPWSVFAGDLDGDGHLDLVTANMYDNTVSVLLNNGDGTFAPQSAYPVYESPAGVFAADLDGDGDLDLATANIYSDNISVLLNNGDGTFAPQSTYAVGDMTMPVAVFAADLDGDGDLDLQTANYGSYDVAVLLNQGNGAFTLSSLYPVGDLPLSVFAADLDGDGDLDLETANCYSHNVSVLLNNGDGTFGTHSVYPAGTGPWSVFAADLDGDEDLDLAVSSEFSSDVSVLMNDGDGTFTPDSVYPVGDAPYSIFAADLDGDGDLDLATANYGSDNVSVLLNQLPFICGDANDNGAVEAGDVVYLIGYLFRSGPAPEPMCVGDANLSGGVEAGDVVYLISYLFRSGPAPSPDCCAR
ncbi:MAG: hypothetical protein GTO24_06150 [candidate division Zixibacteria bacterium]|nr:hypothetical protein [candidate division Zixibacteria bacterium]